MMKNLICIYLIHLVLLTGCTTPPIGGDDNVLPSLRTIQVPILCEKYNNSTDWVYCETANLESIQNVGAVILNVSFRNQKGTESVCYAELFNVTDNMPIPFSNVESEIDYELHTISSDNLRDVLDFEEAKQITIRFRNTGENSTSYISNNSKIIIYY